MSNFFKQILLLGSIFLSLELQSFAQIKSSNELSAIDIRLLTNRETIALGSEISGDKKILIGLKINMSPGWHFYWAGLGAELLEPTINWNIPEGYVLESLNSPKPSLFDYEGIMGYGYSDETVFLYSLTKEGSPDKNYLEDEFVTLTASVDWVACKDICIMGSDKITLDWSFSDKEIKTEESEYLSALYNLNKVNKTASLENLFLGKGIIGWLVAAFLGGVILNLMPCVLPVLSIKVISLIKHSGDSSSRRFSLGLMYSLGVILSFVSLAFILISLRSLGKEVGWGFQLQDPFFMTFLIVLFFLLGLNMIGMYEIGSSLSRFSNSPISNQASLGGSFFTGILAAVAGAPCVGPFIGGVSGIALQVESSLGILIFAMIGVGMAFPFLVLSLAPGFSKFLPKPGIWMLRFQQAMGGLMIFSTAFLIWVVQQSAGLDGFFCIIIILPFLLIAGLLLGRWGRAYKSKITKNRAKLLSMVLILVPAVIAGFKLDRIYESVSLQDKTSVDSLWENWSEQLEQNTLDSGQGLFIDFTASWCLICQSNKAFVLRKEKTESLFKKYNIRLFEADWTHNDPKITRALESYERSGVPLYILKTPDGVVQVLPQNLNYTLLETAVDALFSGEADIGRENSNIVP